ncbi:MAG: CHASE2 domain-containing protein [Microcoleaceae cyanobacterium]
MVSTFHLKVEQIEQIEIVCVFELSWGQAQQLRVTIAYPNTLNSLYQNWQQIYLGFYNQALRGRVVKKGKLESKPIDWYAQLIKAETQLLSEFHHWLRSRELTEIRDTIVQAAMAKMQPNSQAETSSNAGVDILICANPIEIARLPWEAWEIGSRFAAGKIRIARTCRNIPEPSPFSTKSSGKARVLAILGDDRGLDFQAEKTALQSFSKQLEVKIIGWQGKMDRRTPAELRIEIAQQISDPQGWDILFFAGHSNEANGLGGELAIAPNVSLYLTELQGAIKTAIQNGLQFAIFNSCKGLDLADTLISLGLSQVAVMREPIHNEVAEKFLIGFLKYLVQHQDAHDALLSACRSLKSEQQYTYPSASLIPSLCRYPGATVYRLPEYSGDWRGQLWQKIKPILPRKKEAIALSALLLTSWQLSAQEWLLDQRVYLQARYRQLTHQLETAIPQPILLIAIDEESIRKVGLSDPRPMDRQYLAEIINQLNQFDAKVVGLDYLIDRPANDQGENDQILATAVNNAIQQDQTWFIFASKLKQAGVWWDVIDTVAQPEWSLNGDMRVLGDPPYYMSVLPIPTPDSEQRLPLSYLLALGYWMNDQISDQPPQPQLNNTTAFLSQLKAHVIDTTGESYQSLFSTEANLHPLTNWAYLLRQWWLQPIIDYSIPPDRVYSLLPAWQLLESSDPHSLLSNSPVILIAPWGYGEAGVDQEGEDNYLLPTAVKYWRHRIPLDLRPSVFPGAEAHAYMTHHYLNRRLVVPIADVWMILLVAVFAKALSLMMRQHAKHPLRWMGLLGGATLIYGWLSFQLYISGNILLPIIFPIATIWAYMTFALMEKKFYD